MVNFRNLATMCE